MNNSPYSHLSPATKLQQLDEMEKLILARLEIFPPNVASYEPSFARFSKPLRYGIIFMRRGKGWMLNKNWRTTLESKQRELRGLAQPEWTITHSQRLFELLGQLHETLPLFETLFESLTWAEQRWAERQGEEKQALEGELSCAL